MCHEDGSPSLLEPPSGMASNLASHMLFIIVKSLNSAHARGELYTTQNGTTLITILVSCQNSNIKILTVCVRILEGRALGKAVLP